MTSAAYQVGALLEKMVAHDKDYRFMAVNDMMREVQDGTLRLDDDSERKVIRALLKLLNDSNGEVQNLAVKCLGSLIPKIKESQAECLVDSLCTSMVSGSDAERDVNSIALKTVISSLSPTSVSFTTNIVRRLMPKMNAALAETRPTDSVRLEILDIISDIMQRFGGSVQQLHEQTQAVLLNQLSSERQALRKRATVALGLLGASCPAELYNKTVVVLLERLEAAKTVSATRTYVVALSHVAKSNGIRFAPHLPKVVQALMPHLGSEDEELREAILQSVETFFYKCPQEMEPFVTTVAKVLVENLAYDPNYAYGDEDQDESMEVEDEEEEEDDGEEYSDDDDMSWKVRRAAAKAIEAMIVSRRDELSSSLSSLGPVLINRIREREENVRLDVFSALVALLRQARIVVPNSGAAVAKEGETAIQIGSTSFAESRLSPTQITVLQNVNTVAGPLVKVVAKQLKSKSIKTRLACFDLLSDLVRALPGVLTDISPLMAGVEAGLTDKSGGSQMKIDTLNFLSQALHTHRAEVFGPHLEQIVRLIVGATTDSFYKVSAEGLCVVSQLATVIAACGKLELVSPLFAAVSKRLQLTDIDQDVKERAIASAGHFIALFSRQLANEVTGCLGILLDRVRNETTRLPAVRALTEIVSAEGESPATLSLIVEPLLPLLADFLKKNQRALKIGTLHFIEVLLGNEKVDGLDSPGLGLILAEIPILMKDSDLQISQLALRCLTVSLSRFPSQVSSHLPDIVNSFVHLMQSPLLQGATLTATLDAVRALVVSQVPGKPGFEGLLDQLTGPVYDATVSLPRQAFHSMSAVTAVVADASQDVQHGCSLVKMLSDHLKNPACGESIKLFCLHALGEIGRRCPQVYEASPVDPAQLLVSAFNSSQEDFKTAAAQAIGALAVGNLGKFLPFILDQIQTQPKRQYLLLHSLKEVIGWESADGSSIEVFRQKVDEIWPVLMNHAGCAEDGTRNVVAECIGKLCVVDPKNLLPKLKQQIQSESVLIRCSVVTAVKFMISEEKREIDMELQTCIGDFLSAIKDEDLNVRRGALIVLNSAAHNKPTLIRDLLPDLLPAIYGETSTRKELIREVEMGPFKHQVDDGLELRKTAFECMYTLLESCLDKLDVFQFIDHMEAGLKDHHRDIRLLTFLMLIRLAGLSPGQVLQRLDKICEQITAQLTTKPKPNAVKQEIEKLEELKRAAIRAVFALQRIPDADRQPHLSSVLNTMRSNPELKLLTEQVQKDSQRTFVGDVPMDTV